MFRLLSFLWVIVFWSGTRGRKLLKGSSEANKIIAAHKAARNDVRNCKSYAKSGLMPKPADMQYMSYSNEMAQSAEEWGNEACRRGHKGCTHKSNWQNSAGTSVGENLGCSSNTGLIDSFMKQMINDERAKYGWTGNSRGTCNGQNNNNCGHYTQIIWSTSNKVGCAVNTCSNMLICHYSGPGNYPKVPYKATSGCGSSGGNNNGGSNNGGSSSGSAKCCECASSPSKSKCGSTCESAVKGKDSWCGSNAWDSTCKNHAKNLASGCSNSGSSGGNNGGSSQGTCCECKSAPSKSKCSSSCRSAVHAKDNWCSKNSWDGTCKGIATKACSGAFTFAGDCGSEEDDEAVCMSSTLWSDDYNATHRFVVDENQCSNDKKVYNFTAYNEEHRSDILYTLKAAVDHWVLTVSDMKLFENDTVEEIVAAVCNQTDLRQCAKEKWEVKYDDAAKYLRDYLMPQELAVHDGECEAVLAVSEAKGMNDTTVITAVVIGAVIVLVVIGIAVYFCVSRGRNKERINVKELEAIRDDDGCDQVTNDMETTIEVEVETQALN